MCNLHMHMHMHMYMRMCVCGETGSIDAGCRRVCQKRHARLARKWHEVKLTATALNSLSHRQISPARQR